MLLRGRRLRSMLRSCLKRSVTAEAGWQAVEKAQVSAGQANSGEKAPCIGRYMSILSRVKPDKGLGPTPGVRFETGFETLSQGSLLFRNAIRSCVTVVVNQAFAICRDGGPGLLTLIVARGRKGLPWIFKRLRQRSRSRGAPG